MNNMQKSPLQKAVERAHALGRRAVIPFITAGFPDKESFWTHLSRIDEAGADIIEIGVPFSDPVAARLLNRHPGMPWPAASA